MGDSGVSRVYHFCNTEYGLENIKNRRLKVARIMELNDPFELLAQDLKDKNLRHKAKKLKLTVSNIFGFICFSRSYRSPVQWAHYGDRHKGICLGFDVDSKALHKVVYTSARKKPENICFHEEEGFNWFLELLSTKHRSWSYEKEERMVRRLESCERSGNLHFSKFSEVMSLQQVIIGCESDVSGSQVRDVLGEELDSVSVFKVRPAFSKFGMVRNKSLIL